MSNRKDEIAHHVNGLIKAFNDAERLDYSDRKQDHKAALEEQKVLMQHHAAVLFIGALSDLASIADSLRTIADNNSPRVMISGDKP